MRGGWLHFIQLMPVAFLQKLQAKIAAYENQYGGLGETHFSQYLVCGRPS